MQVPARPDNELQRLQALYECSILDTQSEERFDRLTRLAKHMFGTKMALVSLVDAERQWFKSCQGLDASETGRDMSFCGHAILGKDIFYMEDARHDPRFADNPLVTGPPHIRFYAGAPLTTTNGFRIGTLCVIDDQPRRLTPAELNALRDLADCVEDEINQAQLRQQRQALKKAQQLSEVISRAQSQFIREIDRRKSFDDLLSDILALTESAYGFIGEVLRTSEGDPYLKTYAITNIAWNDATRAFYDNHAPQGMEFFNLKTLFGVALTTGEPVIANDPLHDPRRGGLPEGHPELMTFLAIPIHFGGELLAMIGIANRPGGYDQSLIDFLQPLTVTLGQLVQAAHIQQQQHESERRLRSIIEGTRIGTWEWNVQTGKTVFNERWAEIVGYTLAELEPVSIKTWLDLVHPDDLKVSGAVLERHFSGELPYYDVQCRMRHKQGHWVWVHDRGRVISWSQEGKPLLMSGTHAEITEQKLAEAELHRTTDLLRNVLLAATEVSIIATDPHGQITIFNAGAERLLGYTADEMVGKLTPSVIHLPAEIAARGRELTEEFGRPINGFRVFVEKPERDGMEKREWTYVRKDGQHMPVSLVVTTMRTAKGEIIGYLGIAENITQRKQAEMALREQARHTQAVLDNMVDGIITIDQLGIMTSFNPAAEHIFGYRVEEVLGQNVKMLMPSPHHDNHDSYLRNYQTTGIARIIGIGREVEGQRKDGSLFPMELTVSEITRQGKPMYVGMVRDITERKRVERMKSEFVSTVSHELRTPLTSISGALGLLAGGTLGELPEQSRALIDIAQKNSQRLTHLINDLLDMEKIAAGKLHFDLQPQALMPLIEQALAVHRAYGAERQVTLSLTDVAPGVEVRVDSQRLMQIMSNLLSNAIKYSPTAGQVQIAVLRCDPYVRVVVRDQGPGIPEEFHARIFQKFAQADSSDARQKGGTGLGLAITKELVERMGGRIGFESVAGQGASFFFELPLCDAYPLPHATTVVPSTQTKQGPRILVVEDDPDIAQLLGMMLTRAGYRVDITNKGMKALEMLQKARYSAMTLDLMLPDISGLEIIRQLRQSMEMMDFPIIVVSAKMEEGRLAISSDISGIEWLAKPIDEVRLLTVIARQFSTEIKPHPRVLHVEDDADLHQVVRSMAGNRFVFKHITTLAEARACLVQETFDVVILDLTLPDGSGWDLLPEIRQRQPDAHVVILSGTAITVDEARQVEAVLLKSQVGPQQLLEAINTRIHAYQDKGEYR